MKVEIEGSKGVATSERTARREREENANKLVKFANGLRVPFK